MRCGRKPIRGYFAVSDALQYLGNMAFREPVPAYKHSAAIFLHLTGESQATERTRKIRNVLRGKKNYCANARGV